MTWMLRLAAIILAAAMVLMGQAVEQPTEELEFASIQDTAAPEEPETTQEDEPEPIWGVVYEEEETYYGEPYYEPYSGSDGFMQEGVREGVDSDTETWYSSNQAYHYRTGEWEVDDEGYYRDSDGYYVVASNDYEQGTVVTTSKGEAKVYDEGTDSGNIDFYVGW